MKWIFLLLPWSLLLACDTRKVADIRMENRNNYAIRFRIQTNNVKQEFGPVAAGETQHFIYDWTKINDHEGEWVFWIMHAERGSADSFSHGYYQHGELAGFVELISEGSQLKVKISE